MSIQTDDRNRVFAKFLGAIYAPESDEFDMYGVIDTIKDTIEKGENGKHFFKPSEMPFDTDYNWVMALCNKITLLKFGIFIGKLYCRITDYENMYFIIESGDVTSNNEAILDACHKFLKSYKNG